MPFFCLIDPKNCLISGQLSYSRQNFPSNLFKNFKN